MTYNKIFDTLLTIFPYEIVFKILITHKGLEHPTIKLLQPKLLQFKIIRKKRQEEFNLKILRWRERNTQLFIEDQIFQFNSFESILYKDLININSRRQTEYPYTNQHYFFKYINMVSRREGIIKLEEMIQCDRRKFVERGGDITKIPEIRRNERTSHQIIIQEDIWLYGFGRIISDIQKFITLVDDNATIIVNGEPQKLTNKVIKEMLKMNKIKGYSKLKKNELIKLYFSF